MKDKPKTLKETKWRGYEKHGDTITVYFDDTVKLTKILHIRRKP